MELNSDSLSKVSRSGLMDEKKCDLERDILLEMLTQILYWILVVNKSRKYFALSFVIEILV
jgi:hypothetical protein